jgi:RsiW-degrading membrane proteinase PrsW (M82 family)
MIGFIFGVGVTEEVIKCVPLLYFLRNAKEPILPQTLVYYGLISGLGFGLLEGVLYQTTTNVDLTYNVAFFMNIARLTTLPFLHAIWSGIAGYFLAFAHLFPKNRQGLYVLAIAVPALLHGLYDTLGWSILGLGITVFSVFLLMYYLKKSGDYQAKLVQK